MSKISPCLWFNGQAEEAARFYVSVFGGSVDAISHYPPENNSPSPFRGGDVLLVEFTLFGQSYQALNGGPQFTFDEAISLSISCKDQAEIDRWHEALTADGGQAGPCGWVKDKYGLSWQIAPEEILALQLSEDREAVGRMMAALMTMGKLDIAALKAAFAGETV